MDSETIGTLIDETIKRDFVKWAATNPERARQGIPLSELCPWLLDLFNFDDDKESSDAGE